MHEKTRDQNARADGETGEKAGEEAGDIAACADCRQSGSPAEMTDYYRVGAVIQILKYLTEKNGKSKFLNSSLGIFPSVSSTLFVLYATSRVSEKHIL